MQFNDEQRSAIMSLKRTIFVNAGAGSGKTRILTERFIYLCELRLADPTHEAGATVEEIVAITFTEKAAREMRERICLRLTDKEKEAETNDARQFWKEQKETIERSYISTFHSFCQRLLKQHALAADLAPQTKLLDEMEASRKKTTILKEIFSEKDHIERALPLLDTIGKSQLIESLDEIHDFIREHVIGEEAIELLDATSMLQVQKEWNEKKKVELVQEFHHKAVPYVESLTTEGIKNAELNHVKNITAAFTSLEVPEEPQSYMKNLISVMPTRSNKNWQQPLYEFYTEHWQPLKKIWGTIGDETTVCEQTTDFLERYIHLLKEFAHRYKIEKEQAGELDFSDLQQKSITLLQNEAIQTLCRLQFKHMMVDEFQDTNILQLSVIEKIHPHYRFIVGDQKQSIYRFRGANVRLMNEQEEKVKNDHEADSILMNMNYRTETPIIEAVNELFSHVMTEERTHSYETVYTPLKANRNDGKNGEKLVELTVIPEDEEEDHPMYDTLASRIVEMVEEGSPLIQRNDEWRQPSWSDIAILIPARTHLLQLERSLNMANVPYVVNGGIGFFHRQEIVDYLTLLRWLNRPFEDVYLLALLRSPLCGLTVEDFYTMKKMLNEQQSLYELIYDCEHEAYMTLNKTVKSTCEKVSEWLERWTPFRTSVSLEQRLYEIFDETGLRISLLMQANGLQKVKNVEKLIAMIVKNGQMELETILMELDEQIELSEKEGEAEVENVAGDVVQVMTIHASKGLEFPIVCLPQIDRGSRGDTGRIRYHVDYGIVFDLEKDSETKETYTTPCFEIVKEEANAEAEEESKRLFYVAMTRARDYLYMVGKEKAAKQSWLTQMNDALTETKLEQFINKREISNIRIGQPQLTAHYHAPERLEHEDDLLSLSVSEIMLFMTDEKEYEKRYMIGIPRELQRSEKISTQKNKSHLDPSVLGTLVHRACELRDYGLSESAAIAEALNEEEYEGVSSYENELKQLMKHYTEEQRQALGDVHENEWPFTVLVEGVEVIGEIDKIVRKDGKLHLVDFKTNRIRSSGEELIPIYRPQLFLYKMAYEKLTGNKIETVGLYVFRDEENPVHLIKEEKNYEKELLNAIRSLKKLYLNNA